MSNLLKLMMGGGAQPIYSDDVFQSYVRTGTGAEATITTNIDMTEGYTLWSKGRGGATDHAVYDSARGVTYDLVTNSTAAQTTQAEGLKSVSATGHTIGMLAKMNASAATYVDWVFRFAPNFHNAQVVVKSSGSNATVSFPGLTTLGMVVVKRTDSTGSWYVWHRSLTAGKLLIGETTAAETTLGHITVSGTTVTLVNGVIADGTYLVEAWAHDDSAEGIIQCGSFTTDGSGNATVTLGWEPQFVEMKNTGTDVGGVNCSWQMLDVMRGMTADAGGQGQMLLANTSGSEQANYFRGFPNASGFSASSQEVSSTYIYMAIRRNNKPPTVGTQVYNAIARTGTGAAATVTEVGFAPDLYIDRYRSIGADTVVSDRLRGISPYLATNLTTAESGFGGSGNTSFDMDGVSLGSGAPFNAPGNAYINHFFRRAPGFYDEVCDTGTGAAHTITHNLTVAPELMIRKGRSGATQWEVWHSGIANTEKLVLNSTAAKATDTTAWNSTSPTASVFTIGTGANVNTNTATYVTYLFATLAGLSKCGTYTGNGSSQTIDCGFTTGSRFILIKRTDSTGDWFVWDTVRGIVAATDPHLSLNTTAAEVTTDDSVDPDSSGFIVNQLAATNINVTSATYIFLAIA